jgi:hypothetical protein
MAKNQDIESPRAESAYIVGDYLFVQVVGGGQIVAPLSSYPRLAGASFQGRRAFRVSQGGRGIHWPALDEDLSVSGLARDHGIRR